MHENNTYDTPKDFFIYLICMITLYIAFTSAVLLIFNYVNLLFPNKILPESGILGSIRSQIAILIITFPVYLFTLIKIQKDYLRHSEKKNLKVRRWLFYFTLFLAAIIIMSDLGSLLFYFLSGDISSRFLIKSALILLFFGALFIFYLRELDKGWTHTQIMAWFCAAVAIFLLLIVSGFYLAGSPTTARKELLDDKRVSQLILIQEQIIFYWKHKKQLPTTLNQLTNAVTGFKTPVDPVTNKPYGYRVISNNTFELCADFQTKRDEVNLKDGSSDTLEWSWVHPAGHYCFPRTIDPELYKLDDKNMR